MTVERQRAYRVWQGIKNRCYNKKRIRDYKHYGAIGVTMCDDWLVFNNFYNWYQENYYEIDGEYMAIDKDILDKGAMIYSPETCLVVPFRINGMFVCKRNTTIPTGLQRSNSGNFQVKVRDPLDGKNHYIGTFDTIEMAEKAYKECKTVILHNVVLGYGDKLPPKVFKALIDFKF